jgi:hypothetical protein
MFAPEKGAAGNIALMSWATNRSHRHERKCVHVMSNLMEAVFKSIDEVCDLEFARYSRTQDGQDYFYLLEQSALQILRELPSDMPIQVTEVSSHEPRITLEVENLKAAHTARALLDVALPLVEKGNFPCDNITVLLNDKVKLQGHDDGEVHLISSNTAFLQDLLFKVFVRQNYNPNIVPKVIEQPNLYHRLERPGRIVASYKTFEEVVDAL